MFMQINLAAKGSAQSKVRAPLVEVPKRKNEMPDAVKVAIVRAGAFYICSEEVLEVLAPRVQYMEFAEMYGDREREERITYGGKHTKKVRGETLKRFGEMLDKATDEEILDFIRKRYLEIPRNKWGSENVRRAAVCALVKALGNQPRKISYEDFEKNGLYGVLKRYECSPFNALIDAGFAIQPWEMETRAPQGVWKSERIRIAAVDWLVEKTGKEPKNLVTEDFYRNGLGGLLSNYYDNSVYEAVRAAGHDVLPWEMIRTPTRFYEEKEDRIAAIRWLAEKLKKDAKEITREDFEDNGLRGVMPYYRSIYAMLLDAGLVTEADEEYTQSRAIRHMNEARQGKMPSPPSEGMEN